MIVHNYRQHNEKNKRLINKSLVECGAGRSILLDNNNIIIAGNGVFEQAQELGLAVRIIESDEKELIAIRRTDLSTEDDKRKLNGLVKVGGDFCYPAPLLKKKYREIKELCKEVGIKFYCAENRLRYMGENLCCCGIDGLDGFTHNKYNLNHYLYDKSAFLPTKAMGEKGSCGPFKAICQNTISVTAFKNSSLEDMMTACTKDKNMIMQLTDKY